MSKRKKCIVITSFSDNQPGYLVYSYRIKALAEVYELTVVSHGEIKQPELLLPNVEYVAFPRLGGKYGWLKYLFNCAKYLHKNNADLIFLMHSCTYPLSLFAFKAPMFVYWNEHPTNLMHMPSGFSPIKKLVTWLLHRLMFLGARHADIVMPVGVEHKNDLIARGTDTEKIKKIYLGVDDSFVSQETLLSPLKDNKTIQLIFVGTISRERGRDIMLEGLAEAIKVGCHDVHLTLVGAQDEDIEYCQKKALTLDIVNHLTVIKRVQGSEIPKLIAKADIGVAIWADKPWYRINPPTKLFEYLVAGLPVLASDICTHTRYIKNWENGLIFDYSSTAFALLIILISQNKARIQTLKLNATENGKQYLWSKLKPEFLNAISHRLKKNCIVVLSLDSNQPGFLDFSYRLKALAENYALTILSQDAYLQDELNVSTHFVSLGRGKGKLGWLSYLFKCASYIRQHKADVVVLLHSSAAPIALMGVKTPICLYWNEHPTNMIQENVENNPVKNWIARMMQKLVFTGAKKADVVMPIGEEHLDDLLKNGIDPAKLKMIYMGVADTFLLEDTVAYDANHPLELIYVGTISGPRGRDVMIEGLAQAVSMGCKHVRLTLVGANQEQMTFCQNKVNALGVANYITILPRVNGDKIPELLKSGDVGICLWEDRPWWRFNPPTKLFEYLVAGLPVLASNIRTHTRYIKNWENGLIFDYDAHAFAHAIKQLLDHQDKIRVMRARALDAGTQHLWSKLEPVFLNEVSKVAQS